MGEIGSQFGQRDKDETTKVQARMRDLEFGSRDRFGTMEKDIQIDEAGTFGDFFSAAHLGFDGLQGVKKKKWIEGRFGFDDAIQKPRLVEQIHRLGFVNGGSAFQGDARRAEYPNSRTKIGEAVAEVRAER